MSRTGQTVKIRGASGGGGPGAFIDVTGVAIPAVSFHTPDLTNIWRDTNGFVTEATGAGEFSAGVSIFTIPAGLGGLYIVGFNAMRWKVNGASTPYNLTAGAQSDLAYTGPNDWDVQGGCFSQCPGAPWPVVASDSIAQVAGSIVFELVEGDTIGLWIAQPAVEGTLVYAALWLTKLA